MIWRGMELKSVGDVVEYGLKLDREARAEELEEFVEAWAKSHPNALSIVGYFAGYWDAKTSLRIQEIFKTAHPIFGRRIPSAEEAFEEGKRLGEAARRESSQSGGNLS